MNLNKAFYLKKEIDAIRSEIEMINNIDFNTKQLLLNKLNNKIEKYCNELLIIDTYIESIDDIDVRVIARLRYIDNKTWQQIGEIMHLDRTACYRKLNTYLSKQK